MERIYGSLIASMAAPADAGAFYAPSISPTIVSAITAHNAHASAAGVVDLYVTDDATFDETTLVFKSASIAAGAQARLWFSDAPLLLKPGEALGLHGDGGTIHVHLFGIADGRGLRT